MQQGRGNSRSGGQVVAVGGQADRHAVAALAVEVRLQALQGRGGRKGGSGGR